MRKPMYHLSSVVGGLVLSAAAGSASAQWGDACSSCAPVQSCAPVPCQPTCAVPVAQTCYQTVPVTEYREVRQTVQRPVCDVEYVDQQVTEYRPVVEQRTACVPTVSYEDVTEHQCVQRDMGCWQTWQECVNKPTPCEYDNRQNLLGWFNRTNYQMRTAMMPSVVTRRQWVPKIVTTQVPVTRRVARQGTRDVAYNVTRMVPYTTTRKVAVNKVRYVAEEITRSVPVTVYRTVPTGTSIAWATPSHGFGGSATALAPRPDPTASAHHDHRAGEPIRPRTANRNDDRDAPTPSEVEKFERPDNGGMFEKTPGSASREPVRGGADDVIRRQAYPTPVMEPKTEEMIVPTAHQSRDGFRPTNKFRAAAAPSIVRSFRPTMVPESEAGPAIPSPASIAAADTGR